MARFSPGWYVLYTRPSHEKKVAANLNELQIRCYLPLIRSLRAIGNKCKIIDTPLFPSYLFIYLEEMQQYYSGLDLDGVLNYVKIGRDIARVQDQVVENIRLTVASGEQLEVSTEQFLPGEQLVIKEGPLAGLACEVINYNSKDKYLVRVRLMNRCILISADAANLLTDTVMSLPACS
ncbi:UpxY family transcription antiterminator [Chitinophaga pendula]|uniref:transcription termination/antitermination protein NusG n=1 Tax=Chitinophaga TaxID=79328 RepID=UPI000BAEDC3C|nr:MULTISPECIES: UpxY family transcription antiterminator [Chitinophaga]ASZ13682.1 antitermination protein NusG [Chitinophaga sp. MD30]UCJ08701.1 UpxY family transcription antiterminator [Chitinophaga pendula]